MINRVIDATARGIQLTRHVRLTYGLFRAYNNGRTKSIFKTVSLRGNTVHVHPTWWL